MQESDPHSARRIVLPGREEADRAVARARRLFGRTLACWASDMLALRRLGFTQPTWPAPAGGDDAWNRAA